MTRSPAVFLDDMVTFAHDAINIAANQSLDDLARDRTRLLALERALELLGEAASKIPSDIQERWPAIPWREMTGLRNRLAHGYFATDTAILHEIATHDLPVLIGELERMRKMETGD
jgi:uncharacterized protein with HEPN domain